MKNQIYINLVAAFFIVCGLAGASYAQGSVGDTSISYDDASGTVTVFGETTNDIDVEYSSQATVTVKDQNGTTVASGSDLDLYNDASVNLSFTATPGDTYTAETNHCFQLQYWDNNTYYPYSTYYYDDWAMSSFIGHNIYSPWNYWFASPGYRKVHQTLSTFCMGKTYATIDVDPSCPHPTNFRQIGSGTDIGSGTLRFVYEWDSSSGDISDLSACSVGEIVTYPGTGNYTAPSPPFNATFGNPTVPPDISGSDGALQDNHITPGGWITPYTSASFTATQYYRYKCPCKNGGNYVNLVGPISIVRSVSQIGSNYKFLITKSGSSATVNPLP